jgi:hypothetical protein
LKSLADNGGVMACHESEVDSFISIRVRRAIDRRLIWHRLDDYSSEHHTFILTNAGRRAIGQQVPLSVEERLDRMLFAVMRRLRPALGWRLI